MQVERIRDKMIWNLECTFLLGKINCKKMT